MAKGSGTVGRTGRVVDGPQAVDSPVRVTIRRGGGQVPGTGIILGIPIRKRPKPDLIWEDPDEREQVKVSERTAIPSQGEHAGNYKNALENIDKVHTVRKGQNPVQIQTDSRIDALGEHAYISFIEEPSEENGNKATIRTYSNIDINGEDLKTDAQERSVTYHEYGHSYDSQQQDYGNEAVVIPNEVENNNYHRRRFQSENAFRRVLESGDLEYSPGDKPWDRWAKAVIRSKAYQRSMKESGYKTPATEINDNADYWNRPREIFARSYQQFMGTTQDKESLKAMREITPKNQRWSDEDFKDVGKAIEDIFISRNEYVPDETYFRESKTAPSNRIIGTWGIWEGTE